VSARGSKAAVAAPDPGPVRGCAGSHPRPVLRALVGALLQIPTEYSQGALTPHETIGPCLVVGTNTSNGACWHFRQGPVARPTHLRLRTRRTLTCRVPVTYAVSRKENVASAALQAALSWWALDALRVAVASGPNRVCLVEAGALPALAAVLKAALSRLHSMSAVLGATPPLPPCALSPTRCHCSSNSTACSCCTYMALSHPCAYANPD